MSASPAPAVDPSMDRPDSRLFARAVLAAGGDATERTFTGGSSGEGGKP